MPKTFSQLFSVALRLIGSVVKERSDSCRHKFENSVYMFMFNIQAPVVVSTDYYDGCAYVFRKDINKYTNAFLVFESKILL